MYSELRTAPCNSRGIAKAHSDVAVITFTVTQTDEGGWRITFPQMGNHRILEFKSKNRNPINSPEISKSNGPRNRRDSSYRGYVTTWARKPLQPAGRMRGP